MLIRHSDINLYLYLLSSLPSFSHRAPHKIIKGLDKRQAAGMAFQGRLYDTISNLISGHQFSLHIVQILGTKQLFQYMSLNSTVSIGYKIKITSDINEGWYINILNTAVNDGTFADGLFVPGEAQLTVEGFFYLSSISFLNPSPNPSPNPSHQPSPYLNPSPNPYPDPSSATLGTSVGYQGNVLI